MSLGDYANPQKKFYIGDVVRHKHSGRLAEVDQEINHVSNTVLVYWLDSNQSSHVSIDIIELENMNVDKFWEDEFLKEDQFISTASNVKGRHGFNFIPKCDHYMTEFKLKEGSIYLTALSSAIDITKPKPTQGCFLADGWLKQNNLWFTGDAEIDDDLHDMSVVPSMYIDWKDMGVVSIRTLSIAVVWCLRRIREGHTLSIGCFGAHGRTGTLLASILVYEGYTAKDAINKVRDDYCMRAIENKKQEDLIQLYETALSKVGDKNE